MSALMTQNGLHWFHHSCLLAICRACPRQLVVEETSCLEPLFPILSLAINLLLNTLFFGLIYWSLPSAHVRWREVLPGAILATVLWEVAKSAFTLYLSNLRLFNVVYGSVDTIVAFLIWAYLSGCVVLYCGELNAEYARRQHVTRLLQDTSSRRTRRK